MPPIAPTTPALLLLLSSLIASIGPSARPAAAAEDAVADAPQVRIATTLGDIVVELDRRRAPRTVDNFLGYVDASFYDDTLFHRVIEGFMIQGGGFSRDFERRDTREPIANEADNGLSNRRYTIAMARTNAPHSATAQFFVNTADNTNLDHTAPTARGWGYTVFGRVIEGQDVVDRISRVPTGAGGPFSRDAPREPVVILETRRVAPAAESDAGAAGEEPEPASAVPDEGEPLPVEDAEEPRGAYGSGALRRTLG